MKTRSSLQSASNISILTGFKNVQNLTTSHGPDFTPCNVLQCNNLPHITSPQHVTTIFMRMNNPQDSSQFYKYFFFCSQDHLPLNSYQTHKDTIYLYTISIETQNKTTKVAPFTTQKINPERIIMMHQVDSYTILTTYPQINKCFHTK